ncbi:putative secondary metabolism biosynthetic enzyme [Elasticomyces elasticus]|uniref:hydroxymethylglutaryl-CoA lyase n=1 Tax=Exophiala sideris TaxID=1016849 RepID=A0ABR0JDM4_9EURO|nr:putative secondary metabolism biosynthetic enzyme [Elasticomyces elasticus]KAK5031715.1 hypothetical protein LTS07_004335 [Exophiala sideris]KAK5040644.1 putative secondary metabolism biosynthetic enzyme [Exophiala sideris]KAK5062022.1 hypothetical protein LTR69_005206 [Exophiala sideris]KAK5184722.1 putative secondary metabolism biosynthetic enzyme [Eurotiomycetes sp. CCFEE 6388]
MAFALVAEALPPVRIVEVGPRDGLQNVDNTIPTSVKVDLIHRLLQTGLKTVEVTSIVSPKAIPQLADCRQVLADPKLRSLLPDNSLRLPVLVPNIKSLSVAIDDGVREVAVFVSATEGFSRANIRASVEEGLLRAKDVAERASKAGLAVRGYVSCIFADPYEGPTTPEAVLKVVQQLLQMGCYEVSLGDTLGVGTAADTRSLIDYLQQHGIPLHKLAGHFHDTYGQAVSNVWQAYQCGIRVFDCSVAGLGGCPYAPGAKGNVATEDVVYLFDQAGIHTGINLVKLVEVGVWISGQLRKSNSSRAGAALAAKSKSSIKSIGPKHVDALKWRLVTTTDGLKIYQLGPNVKIVLDRPRNGNALTVTMISELTDFFTRAKSDTTIWRIAIQGTGKFFCTGMDLGKGTSPVARTRADSDAQYDRLTCLFEAIDTAPQVTIACVNGAAFGGGVGLAFACDIRIATAGSTMNLSEVKLGLCPATISKYVIREWGLAFAREAMLSARPVSTMELKAVGAISQVVEDDVDGDGLSRALDLYLAKIKVAAPKASSMCKELVRLEWKEAGSPKQASGIKTLFDEMMKADGEAAVGLKQFQSGIKSPSWEELLLSNALRSKL